MFYYDIDDDYPIDYLVEITNVIFDDNMPSDADKPLGNLIIVIADAEIDEVINNNTDNNSGDTSQAVISIMEIDEVINNNTNNNPSDASLAVISKVTESTGLSETSAPAAFTNNANTPELADIDYKDSSELACSNPTINHIEKGGNCIFRSLLD